MTIEIKVEKRDQIGKLESLREEGLIPAVFYGHKKDSTPIQLKKIDFIKAWRSAGESTVITLMLGSEKMDALIHDVDIDPVSGEPRHADFYVFEKGHKVEIEIPLVFEGVSTAVKELGGILIKSLRELKISAEPSNLPHEIVVDISSLSTLDSQILAKDIKLPAGVSLIEDGEEVVASISVAQEEKEEPVAVDLSKIEVEKKGKKDDEEVVA